MFAAETKKPGAIKEYRYGVDAGFPGTVAGYSRKLRNYQNFLGTWDKFLRTNVLVLFTATVFLGRFIRSSVVHTVFPSLYY
jgi:hypothetical protein